MEVLQHLAEITVSYRTRVKARDRIRITNSQDAHKVLFQLWDTNTIEYQEAFYLLLLNKANAILGYKLVSIGGSAGTVVDIKQLLAIALVTNSAGIIMAHNHPSGNLQPSQADLDLTRKVKNACQFLDLALLDHVILSPDGAYRSFADEGDLWNGQDNRKSKKVKITGLPVHVTWPLA